MRRLSIALLAAAVPLLVQAQPRILSNSWDDDKPSTFTHVVESTPGAKTVTLHARTDASGGQTVSIYPAGPDRGAAKGRLLFVVANRAGERRVGTLTFPPAGPGGISRLPLVVVVENATASRQTGEYTLTVSP